MFSALLVLVKELNFKELSTVDSLMVIQFIKLLIKNNRSTHNNCKNSRSSNSNGDGKNDRTARIASDSSNSNSKGQTVTATVIETARAHSRLNVGALIIRIGFGGFLIIILV